MGTVKTSRRLVGSSTVDAEMMCGEQQSASAALFTCGQGEGARCWGAGLINTTHSDGDEIWNIDHLRELGMWWAMRRKHLRHPLTLVSASWVCILYMYFTPSSWLLAPNWCARKQGAGWHVTSGCTDAPYTGALFQTMSQCQGIIQLQSDRSHRAAEVLKLWITLERKESPSKLLENRRQQQITDKLYCTFVYSRTDKKHLNSYKIDY